METNTNQYQASESKPGSKPDAKVKVTKNEMQVVLVLSANDGQDIMEI